MKPPQVITVDFETKGIQNRPEYPPMPVGVSIKYPGDKPNYYAWGHPTKNNCTLVQAKAVLKEVWKDPYQKLFHNAKFDLDVAETHMGVRQLKWEEFHDTMFLLFLNDPHAMSLSLKPSAEKLLGMKPEEQDAVRKWLEDNKVIRKKQGNWGAHIWEAPGNVVGKYANGDVVRTEKLFKFLYPKVIANSMGGAYDRERKLLPIFLENERKGLRVDLKNLEKDIAIYQKAMVKIESWLRKRLKAPTDTNFDSDVTIGNLLDENKIVTEWVLTKTMKRSVAKKNMTIERFKDKKVFYALGYRNRLKTCLSMFMEPWLSEGQRTGGHIHPNWNQVRQAKGEGASKGTRTGRPSCDNPNLLNLSKSFYDRGDGYEHPRFLKSLPELPLVRKYTLPDTNCVWVHRDYNQQELRILAHFEDGAILRAYKDNPELDVHTFVQSEIKRLMYRDIDRVSVKTMNFGKLYGQGLGALAEKLQVSVEEVKSIRDAQTRALPGLKDLEDAIKATSKAGEPIVTWGGRLYYCEPPKFVEKFGRVMDFDYKLLNYLIQGSAADATKEAIIRYDKKKKHGRFIVTVYDEINICVPKQHLKTENKILKDCMESIEFDVLLRSDCKVGKSWGDLTKYKE